MIELIRKKFGLKILELRYVNQLIEEKGFDTVKCYSLKELEEEGWNKTKTCTMQIDLSLTEEELWKNIKKNYRKHIRTEEIKGIKVEKSKDYHQFYDELYIPLCKTNKLKPYPINYFKQGDLWIAKKDCEILSGSIIFKDAKYATQSFTASNHIEYNGNRLLIWTALKYYKNKGLKYFNFGGGESDYKKRFGSEKKDVWISMNYITKKAKLLNKIRGFIKK